MPSEQLEPEKQQLPAWAEPPLAERSFLVEWDRVLAASKRADVALLELRAFRTGCLLNIVASVRREPDEQLWTPEAWWRIDAEDRESGVLPDSVLRFMVELSDGRHASSLSRWRGQPASVEPELALVPRGRRVRTHRGRRAELVGELWLWPLPAGESLSLAVEWPAFDVPITWQPIDLTPVHAAASHAGPIWP